MWLGSATPLVSCQGAAAQWVCCIVSHWLSVCVLSLLSHADCGGGEVVCGGA